MLGIKAVAEFDRAMRRLDATLGKTLKPPTATQLLYKPSAEELTAHLRRLVSFGFSAEHLSTSRKRAVTLEPHGLRASWGEFYSALSKVIVSLKRVSRQS